MVVRRNIAEIYAIQKAKGGVFFGRKGDSLLSSDDYELSLIAADEGTGYGVFRRLSVTHLIPARRVEQEYILRLHEACAQSDLTLTLTRAEKLNAGSVGFAQIVRRLLPPFYKMILGKGMAKSIFYRVFIGRCKAVRTYRSMVGNGPPLNDSKAT